MSLAVEMIEARLRDLREDLKDCDTQEEAALAELDALRDDREYTGRAIIELEAALAVLTRPPGEGGEGVLTPSTPEAARSDPSGGETT